MQEAGRLHLNPNSVTHELGTSRQVTSSPTPIPASPLQAGGDDWALVPVEIGSRRGVPAVHFLPRVPVTPSAWRNRCPQRPRWAGEETSI